MTDTARETVYVVEDDEGFRTALVRMLRVTGYTVAPFSSAREFLEHGSPGPGCLLLDLQLPDLSGMEVQQQLAQSHPALPIVFLTGHGTVRSSVQAIRAGAEDFLSKPVEEPQLLAAIERALSRDRERRGADRRIEELRQRYETLTPNERRVMSGVISGHLNKQIAYQFGRDLRTIKSYRAGVMKKMGADSTADLVRMAGLLQIPIEPPEV